MRRVILGVLMAMAVSITASAQPLPKPLKVHIPEAQRVQLGYPEYYTDWSQAVWVTAQGHWAKNPNVEQTNNTMMQHTHADILWFPYAELDGPMEFPVRVTLHLTPGHLIGIFGDTAWQSSSMAMLDAPVRMDTSAPYPGNPNGNVTYTGHILVDPTRPRNTGEPSIQKGWFATMFSVTTLLDGVLDDTSPAITVPYYSMVDPSAPEPTGPNQAYPVLRATFAPHTPRTTTSWGTAISQHGFELNEFIPYPKAVQTQPWYGLLRTAGYGAGITLPPATVQGRIDPDFHNGVEGTVLQPEATGTIDVNLPIELNPAQIAKSTAPAGYAPGDHAVREMWCQPDLPGTGFFDKACVILGFDIRVPVLAKVFVPDVVGWQRVDAVDALRAAGLEEGLVTEQVSETDVPGTVLAQDPMADTEVLTGTSVNLTVAIAPLPPPPTTVSVPNVVRMTLANATAALQAAGLVVGDVLHNPPNPAAPPVTLVTAQNPAAGTQVNVGSAVSLTLSR